MGFHRISDRFDTLDVMFIALLCFALVVGAFRSFQMALGETALTDHRLGDDSRARRGQKGTRRFGRLQAHAGPWDRGFASRIGILSITHGRDFSDTVC